MALCARTLSSSLGGAVGPVVARRAARTQAPRRVAARAADAKAPAKADKKETEEKPEPPVWTEPVLDPSTPSPIFGGSSGGLLRKAQVEEFYVRAAGAPAAQRAPGRLPRAPAGPPAHPRCAARAARPQRAG